MDVGLMDVALALKVVHVLGATVFLGTGAGIAFFMLMAHRTADPALIAHTAGIVVIADALFTATAVILQPLTGLALAWIEGYPLLHGWISVSLGLYVAIALCWLPVVVIQIRLRDMARLSARDGLPMPPAYTTLFSAWLALGVVALVAVLLLIWLMVAKPSF